MTVTIKAKALEAFVADIFASAGCSKEEGGRIGRGEILLPGEPEVRMRAQRLAAGVPLPDDTRAAIVETARSVGLEERRIQQATI